MEISLSGGGSTRRWPCTKSGAVYLFPCVAPTRPPLPFAPIAGRRWPAGPDEGALVAAMHGPSPGAFAPPSPRTAGRGATGRAITSAPSFMAKQRKQSGADIDWYLISIDRLKQIGLV